MDDKELDRLFGRDSGSDEEKETLKKTGRSRPKSLKRRLLNLSPNMSAKKSHPEKKSPKKKKNLKRNPAKKKNRK